MLGIIAFVLKFCLRYLPQLGAHLDAEAGRKLQEYDRQKREIEQEKAELETEIRAGFERTEELKSVRDVLLGAETDLDFDIAQINDRLKEIENEKNEKLARLDGLSDDDVLRSVVRAADRKSPRP